MSGAPVAGGSQELQDAEALATDRYLDSILIAHARGVDTGPILAGDRLDPNVRLAADRLARELPRLHPSFRFEEALAGKLAEAAARLRLPLAAGGEGGVVPLSGRRQFVSAPDDDGGQHRDEARPAIGRPLLIGGALTSAALSIAGAAYVAWRLRNAPSSPMARAVRAVARMRLA